jgi:succinoglycan biosynthesis protein ExoW
MIAVIVPFYQKETGLLRRALLSVAAQAGEPPPSIYVVDDGSPAPVDAELCGLPASLIQNLTVLRQPNAGPGAARNLALDSLPSQISAVAFLDSDDQWRERHLFHIRTALAAGADFYFTDHQRQEDAQTRFAQCRYTPDGQPIGDGGIPIAWCDTAELFRAIVMRSPVGTSTVAVRRNYIGETRFPTVLRAAGEDSIFWLYLLSRCVHTACCSENEVSYGRGVSIFNHRSWGDVRAMQTTLDAMLAQRFLRKQFDLDDFLIAESNAQCRRLDLAFCRALIACVRRMQWDAANAAASYLRNRPQALVRFPRAAFDAIEQQFRTRTA